MTVILYTQPGCGPCMATKRALDKAGIPYEVRDVQADEEAAERLRELEYPGTPVVEVTTPHGSYHWHGFRKDKIDHLAHQYGGLTHTQEGAENASY